MCGHCCDFTILLNDGGKLESLLKGGGPGGRFPQTPGCKAKDCFVNFVASAANFIQKDLNSKVAYLAECRYI